MRATIVRARRRERPTCETRTKWCWVRGNAEGGARRPLQPRAHLGGRADGEQGVEPGGQAAGAVVYHPPGEGPGQADGVAGEERVARGRGVLEQQRRRDAAAERGQQAHPVVDQPAVAVAAPEHGRHGEAVPQQERLEGQLRVNAGGLPQQGLERRAHSPGVHGDVMCALGSRLWAFREQEAAFAANARPQHACWPMNFARPAVGPWKHPADQRWAEPKAPQFPIVYFGPQASYANIEKKAAES